MSDRSERFFVWVWRVNGLLLLGAAIVGLVGGLVLAYNIGVSATREDPEKQLTRVAGADPRSQDVRLADFHEIAGTQLLYAQLASPSEYIGSGSSGGVGLARNLLFFDTASKKAHWLLPTNDQTIPSFSFLMDPPGIRYAYEDGSARERKQVAIAVLVELKKPHGAQAADASRSLAVASVDGRAVTQIADPIEALLGYHQPAKDSVLIFYVSGGAARVLDLDPITRTVRSDELLSTD